MLFRNTLWNLLGEGLPMLAALLSIPWLMAHIGLERFGSLTLIWAFLGCLAVLDFGMVRALVQIIADRRGRPEPAPDAGIAGRALGVIAAVGAVTAGAVAVAGDPLISLFIHASDTVTTEVHRSLWIITLIIPVALVSAGLRGVLEGYQRFRAINLVRMTVGVMNYLSPLCVLPFSDSLVPVIAAIALGRVLGLAAYGWLCVRLIPDLLAPSRYRREPMRPLFVMGAWMMLNNLLGPAMLYADRIILASLVPAAAVAFYTTPFEVLSRLLFIPGALSSVLFPLAASLFHKTPEALGRMLDLGAHMALGVFLLILGVVAVSGEAALNLWLGAEFAGHSALILSVLALGVCFNAVAFVPSALIQGIGRVDVTAKLQLAELPVYLLVLWWLIGAYGPLGAAVAWTLRTGADMVLLLVALPVLAPGSKRPAALVGITTVLAGAAGALGLAIGGETGTVVALLGLAGGLAAVARRLLALRAAGTVPAARDLRIPSALTRFGG